MNINIDKSQRKLHSCIDKYGIGHPRTLRASEELDIIIVEEQKIRWRAYE